MQNILAHDQKSQFVFQWFGDEDRDEQHEIVLEGDNSEADIYGIFYGHDRSTFKSNLKVVHKGKNTRAHVHACGVVVDSSVIDFSGMLRVEHGAKGTRTFFRANLMILSPQASANTFPGLEIEENDIAQGGHAATVGKINEDQLFYLMSRGLPLIEAKNIVIRGFFEPVLQKLAAVESDVIREKLDSLL